MGDYRYPNDQVDDSAGIIRTADKQFIPVNTGLGAWLDYLTWRAVPNTPDPATALTVAEERVITKGKVDRDSEVEFQKELTFKHALSPSAIFGLEKLVQEAEEIVRDAMAFSAARHPMINELIGVEGATGADVAAAISTWWDGKKVRIGKVNKERWKAHKDIDAAGTIAAVRAIYTGLTWPA